MLAKSTSATWSAPKPTTGSTGGPRVRIGSPLGDRVDNLGHHWSGNFPKSRDVRQGLHRTQVRRRRAWAMHAQTPLYLAPRVHCLVVTIGKRNPIETFNKTQAPTMARPLVNPTGGTRGLGSHTRHLKIAGHSMSPLL